jgi:hypothetical protein
VAEASLEPGLLEPGSLDPGSLDPIETDSYPVRSPATAAPTVRDPERAGAGDSAKPTSDAGRESDASHETLISSQPERPIFQGAAFVTGTQPSMPAFAEPPPSSRDLRRMWHIDEHFHRQDARMRLLEKELNQSRKVALAAVGLSVLSLGLALLSLI